MFLASTGGFPGGPLYRLIKRSPRICVIAASAIIFSIMFFSPLHVTMIRFESVKYSFALWTDADSETFTPHVGEYVLFHWHDAKHEFAGLKRNDLLIKKIGCLPGNVLEIQDGDRFFCDGSYLGRAVEKMPISQQPVSVFPYPQQSIVPDGQLFVIGDSHSSYDSKYFGFVPVEHVMGRVLFGIN